MPPSGCARSRPWLASWVAMATSNPSGFPVTVRQLPVVRCQICRRTMAHRPGDASAVLTEHYRRFHAEAVTPPD